MKRLLIANRGEIAVRILRACRELGIEVVAAYTQADSELPYLFDADDKVCIHRQSYLEPTELIAAALSRRCDAIHPGYGFLAENSEFAHMVERENMVFVGPASDHVSLMGDKQNGRRFMSSKGISVVPGTTLSDAEDYAKIAQVQTKIGYPIILKASQGGGGKGMTVVSSEAELRQKLQLARAEALNLFGSDDVYAEKYLQNARHIEIQIFGDGRGQVSYFGARDCSVQRRHQKLVEESPPAGIEPSRIENLGQQCCEVLADIAYSGAGTLEFLFADDEFYFIEMNTRMQVEHPVTECVTSIDLVKLQLRLHQDAEFTLPVSTLGSGHAIECRINAEDEYGTPHAGRVNELHIPGGPGIRVDTHLRQGYRLPHQYDSLLLKLITQGENRAEAISRMQRALAELVIRGQINNRKLHQSIMLDERFLSGDYSTEFMKDHGQGTL